MMEKRRVLSALMAATMANSVLGAMPTVMAASSDAVLLPTADTYVNNNDKNAINGRLSYAVLGSTYEENGKNTIPGGINGWNDSTEDINVAYLSFDISAIDVSRLDSVSLRLNLLEENAQAHGAKVSVFAADEEFDEDGTTWENRPHITDFVEEGGETDNITDSDALASAEISGTEIVVNNLYKYVKKALDEGKTTVTFAVYLNKDVTIKISSREGSENAPKLETKVIDDEAIDAVKAAYEEIPYPNSATFREFLDDTQTGENALMRAKRDAANDKYNALTAVEKSVFLSNTDSSKVWKEVYDINAWNAIIKDAKDAIDTIALINDINGGEPIAAPTKPEDKTVSVDKYIGYGHKILSAEEKWAAISYRARLFVSNKVYNVLTVSRTHFDGYLTNDAI